MQAWVEYHNGRLPYAGAVADQDAAVLTGLQLFSAERSRIHAESRERDERKQRSEKITQDMRRSGISSLPRGVNVAGGS